MKKQILFAMLLLMGMAVQAQDVQLHYDFGRNIYPDEEAGRQKVTMTLEQFKADKWGSWFYFVDIDFFVTYQVTDPLQYMYATEKPELILKNLIQSTIRGTVSAYTVDSALTTGKPISRSFSATMLLPAPV